VDDPAARDLTFAELEQAYYDQTRGLIDGGADLLMLETFFDTLNAKAAIHAILRLFDERGSRLPVMVSGTLTPSGRTLSGQTVEAFYASVAHVEPVAVSLNCSFGARQLLPYLERLAGLGLAQPPSSAPPPPPRQDDRPPEYTRGDVAAALEKEPDFQGLCRELEGMLGRVFTDSDLRCAYTIYDHLGLPPEVILLLAGWAVRRERRAKNSPAACPRMPQIQRMAFQWKRLGLDTLERAEDYLRREEQVDGREWEILSSLGVAERRPAVGRERKSGSPCCADPGADAGAE